MSFTDELQKFALLLFTTCPALLNTRLLGAILATCRTYFLQDHWELETPICGLAITGRCHYTIAPKALCSVFLAHVTFTCLRSTFSYPHKKLLSRAWPTLARIALALYCTRPTIVGTRTPCRLTNPAKDSKRYATIWCCCSVFRFDQHH